MKMYWGREVDVQLHAFLTSALDGDELCASRAGFNPLCMDPRYLLETARWAPEPV
jgi:hypothetical protein